MERRQRLECPLVILARGHLAFERARRHAQKELRLRRRFHSMLQQLPRLGVLTRRDQLRDPLFQPNHRAVPRDVIQHRRLRRLGVRLRILGLRLRVGR
eukprot:3333243-Prymnesium_polylepis.1